MPLIDKLAASVVVSQPLKRSVGQTEAAMGINVQVESETGVAEGEVLDSHNLTQHLLLAQSDSDWACLRFVDRFGDTVFNQLQVPVLLSELRRRVKSLDHRQATARAHGEAILRLLEQWEGRTHTYVRFVGD